MSYEEERGKGMGNRNRAERAPPYRLNLFVIPRPELPNKVGGSRQGKRARQEIGVRVPRGDLPHLVGLSSFVFPLCSVQLDLATARTDKASDNAQRGNLPQEEASLGIRCCVLKLNVLARPHAGVIFRRIDQFDWRHCRPAIGTFRCPLIHGRFLRLCLIVGNI